MRTFCVLLKDVLGWICVSPGKQILTHRKKGTLKWSDAFENVDCFRRQDALGHRVHLGKRLEDLIVGILHGGSLSHGGNQVRCCEGVSRSRGLFISKHFVTC